MLIAKLLQITSTAGWGCHLFAIEFCQSQLLITMYTKIILIVLLSVSFIIVELSPDGTPHLDVSHVREASHPRLHSSGVTVSPPCPLSIGEVELY